MWKHIFLLLPVTIKSHMNQNPAAVYWAPAIFGSSSHIHLTGRRTVGALLISISIKQALLMSKLDQSSSVLLFPLCLAFLWQQRLQILCRAPLMSRGRNWAFSTSSSVYSDLPACCIRALQHLLLKNRIPVPQTRQDRTHISTMWIF